MNLVFGCDPNAVDLKKILIDYAVSLGHKVMDYGSDDAIYANTAVKVARDVVAKKFDRGILVCGTGIGVAIAANKVKGVYAANLNNIYQAQRAVLSNNANVVTFGSQVIGVEVAKCLLKEYLSLEYDPNSRSGKKVERICEYEEEF
ncbi:MAG: RpiB/LacA/LacB family sugar-phosphate isomerase [Elusimicrobiota bacterium]|jgi:ribose 5-phosphate isomerase B|nr:RpiB/LacA/LacB family sugar-phosphate isomerase [Elusimicrobiota bacterium]